MSEQAEVTGPLPVVSWLKLPEGADPYLEGHKCRECGAIYLGTRENCSSCGARDKMTATKLSTKGKLYSYSIVHRSFPGIEVPYVSAIVDLEGGGTVKGNLSTSIQTLTRSNSICRWRWYFRMHSVARIRTATATSVISFSQLSFTVQSPLES